MKKNITHALSLIFLILCCSSHAQTLTLRQTQPSGWNKAILSGETVAFSTAASSPAQLSFSIVNTGSDVLDLTGSPAVAISSLSAASFSITQPASTSLAPNAATSFVVTYNPTASAIAQAQLNIQSNAGTFSISLKGAAYNLYGPQGSPIGTVSTDSNGNIGRAGGRNLFITNVSLATKTETYWGPQINSAADLGIKVSLDNSSYTSQETLTFSASESNLAQGIAVWRGQTFIQNAINFSTVPVMIRARLTTKRPDNSAVPMTNPTSLGLNEQIGGLVPFTALNDYLVANIFIEASFNGVSWQPYLDLYDAYPTPPGPLPSAGIGNAYSTFSTGFYWKNLGPRLTQNAILSVNEGASATISTSTLNATDDEDMPANPGAIRFYFESTNPGDNPMVFGTGVLKKSGVAMTKISTFTLADLQNGLITFEHDGSETVYDEFQFSFRDSKNKLGADGPATIFSYKIGINPVNDLPVAEDQVVQTSYVGSYAGTLSATDPDNSALTYSIVAAPSHGFISLNASTGEFTYTPSLGGPGTDSFTFTASDGNGTSNVATVAINLVNSAPISQDQSFTIQEGTTLVANLTATDPEGNTVNFLPQTIANMGWFQITAAGALSYYPNANAFGTDSFTFKVVDSFGNMSGPYTATIHIRPKMDAGDFVVVDYDKIRYYDPVNNHNIVLSEGNLLTEALNAAYNHSAGLFAYDLDNGLLKIDPLTGDQSVVAPASAFSTDGPIGGPAGMTFDSNRQLVMSQAGSIVSVNPETGAVTTLHSGDQLSYPTSVAYLSNGDLIATDAGLILGGTSKLVRITPQGIQSVISSGNHILLPLDFALVDQNTAVVSDGGGFAGGTNKVYTVDLTTGAQTLLAEGGSLEIPSGIDFFGGNIYIVNKEGARKIIKMLASNAIQSEIATPALSNPWGLAVIPAPLEITSTSTASVSCNLSNGNVTVAFAGGNAPYSISINSGTPQSFNSSPATIEGLAAGDYTLGLTEAGGASAQTSFTIGTNADTTPPTITAPANIAQCSASVDLGTPVTADDCEVASVTNNAPEIFPTGETTVVWTVTDSSGNTATANQTVTVYGAPTATQPSNLVSCSDKPVATFYLPQQTPIILNGQSTSLYTVSYHSTLDGANNNTNVIANASSYTAANGTTIYARVRLNAHPECYAVTSFQLVVIPSPEVDSPEDVVSCGPYTLPALTNGNYFSDLNGQGTAYFAGDTISESMTLFVFNHVDPDGCSATSEFSVTILPGQEFYADADGDGFGDANNSVFSCTGQPEGYVSNSLDCDDNAILYADADGDGYGINVIAACGAYNNTDCNDVDPSVWQSGTLYVDEDMDGYSSGETATICYGTIPAGFVAEPTEIDCNDSIASVHPNAVEIPYNGIDDNCDGTIDEGSQIYSQVLPAQCGTTLASISSVVGAVSFGAPVDGYRFKVVNVATNQEQIIDRNVPHFQLTSLATYDYASTYSISVMLKRNGLWLNYYGPACQVSTPAVLDAGGAAAIAPSQCGIVLPTISTLIATTSLPGVTAYRFRITDTATNQQQIIERNYHWFSLTMLESFLYGRTYSVEVSVKTNGAFSGFGQPCTVTAPAVPMISNCGITIATKGTLISTTSLNRVTSYRFQLTDMNTFETIIIDRTQNYFSFMQVPEFIPGAQYAVSVAVMTAGAWSDFGEACIITAPGAARSIEREETPASPTVFRAVAYPSPFVESFAIDMDTDSQENVKVSVYDMVGRMVEEREFNVQAIESQQFGERFPSGVYNVILSQGDTVKTLRVIKR